MRMCKNCGADKGRWPRSCSRCRAKSDKDALIDGAADVAVETGLFGAIWRGMTGVVRLALRAFD